MAGGYLCETCKGLPTDSYIGCPAQIDDVEKAYKQEQELQLQLEPKHGRSPHLHRDPVPQTLISAQSLAF